MSTFDNNEKDGLLCELELFLKEHSVEELKEIVEYAISEKINGYLE